ncbi:hypothetical protein HIM_12122 [Hirsutella minnesotensis 3608]|uniref:Chloride channel protein n=1 Tax=Hirsutella minnesotensis 3608 TaxID=1043627 RepID=A0A0F7ZW76_9HYPO|nr:hypothetical protein HIM_12122 [Hirsutella minnesotensis 3608]
MPVDMVHELRVRVRERYFHFQPVVWRLDCYEAWVKIESDDIGEDAPPTLLPLAKSDVFDPEKSRSWPLSCCWDAVKWNVPFWLACFRSHGDNVVLGETDLGKLLLRIFDKPPREAEAHQGGEIRGAVLVKDEEDIVRRGLLETKMRFKEGTHLKGLSHCRSSGSTGPERQRKRRLNKYLGQESEELEAVEMLSLRLLPRLEKWTEVLHYHPFGKERTEFLVYMLCVIGFATFSCWLVLWTKTVVPSAYRLTTLDENLAAETLPKVLDDDETDLTNAHQEDVSETQSRPMVYYSAAGSGVAEVRVILSGFVLPGFLGFRTLIIKMVSLVFSVSSGLSLGKEGPFVHMAACVGSIACRLFPKYDHSEGKRRAVLSAAAAAGVAVAFGAPIGGVLFGLEEVAHFFMAKTLFRTFFCCIIAAISLKFLNPYGTHKIVMFEVRYANDWEFFELLGFMLVGVLGGAIGALFIKAHKHWAQSFRRIAIIKTYPIFEVFLVAVITGLMSYWTAMTRLPVSRLLLNLASPCHGSTDINRVDLGICPSSMDDIPPILLRLFTAFLIKGFLTIITFGIKVPSGIYIPSMVCGGLLGRLFGHLVQLIVMAAPNWTIFGKCATSMEGTCIQPGVYGLIAAGATMCGTTRLSVTLAVILFELTGSLDYVLLSRILSTIR